MKIIAPDYYSEFACLMGACRHSCCIGWEIDIDEDSLRYFLSIGGEIGEKLKNNVIAGDDCACFRLGSDERCPFLNAEGLCELILTLGEDSLCQICADHPRFRNCFSDREEIGLGLCCEAAAQLILKSSEKTGLMILEDDGCTEEQDPFEQDLLCLRDALTAHMQDRSRSFMERISSLPLAAGIDLPDIRISAWRDFLLSLERLDDSWADRLASLDRLSPAVSLPAVLDAPFEQLAVYLLFRHLPGALEDDDLSGRIAFICLMLHLFMGLCRAQVAQGGHCSADDLCEFARMYSSEIEYSDENIGAILDELHRVYPEI